MTMIIKNTVDILINTTLINSKLHFQYHWILIKTPMKTIIKHKKQQQTNNIKFLPISWQK